MNRGVYTLLLAQFLTAFADNAIFFTALAIIQNQATVGEWYKPALQAAFLLAFVFLAPWVGPFADKRPKAQVLMIGNAIKAAGALLVMVHVEPLIAYCIIGIGAAVYGPAKYGILPEMVGHQHLVKANGWIEGSTIVAIVLGTAVGAKIADQSINAALIMVTVLYVISLAAAFFIPKTASGVVPDTRSVVSHFIGMMRLFFETPRARFSMLGASVFWAASVTLRVMMLTWAPYVLGTRTQTGVATLVLFAAGGIAAGSLLAIKFVPIEYLRRARYAAYVMGVAIMAFWFVETTWQARIVLVVVGLAGGIFVVPINAALQELGHRSVGSGGAVAIQNFFENAAMLAATTLYTLAIGLGAQPVASLMVLGVLVLLATFIISRHLPPDPRETVPATEADSIPVNSDE